MSRFEAASPQKSYISQQIQKIEQKYLEEWTNSSRLLFYSVIIFSLIAIPAFLISLGRLMFVKSSCNTYYFPYLCAILIANMVLLGSLLGSVITENSDFVYSLVPGIIVCKLTAFLVNTSSCFIHWTWVAMYAQRFIFVFFPLRARRTVFSQSIILIGILIISGLLQIWTLVFITAIHLDDENLDSMYCGGDPQYSTESNQIIAIIECTITFFVPLFLTIISDFSVLFWNNSCGQQFTLVSNDGICEGGRKKSNMKIVSMDCLKRTQCKRAQAIRRCLISATITLLFNLPNYSLQILDEFLELRDNPSIDVRRFYLKIDAFVYILYLMQFPLTPVHIFFLTFNTAKTKSRSPNTSNRLNNCCNSSVVVHV